MIQVLTLEVYLYTRLSAATNALAEAFCVLQRRGAALVVSADLVELGDELRVLAELEVAGLDLVHLCLEGRGDEAAAVGAEEAVSIWVGGEVGLGFGFHDGDFKVKVGCT